MSHFTVLVVGDDVEEQLAPFDENLHVDPYPSPHYTEGKVVEDLQAAAANAADAGKPEALRALADDIMTHGYTDGIRRHEAAFREFVQEHYEMPLDDQFRLLTTYNPNSQWDWYAIGGRWSKFFKLKPGTTGQAGDSRRPVTGRVDRCRFGDIDIRGMKADAMRDARRAWKEAEGKSEAERQFGYGIEPGQTRRQYIEDAGRFAFTTFAILTRDGQWVERGSMGWFGMVADEQSADDWLRRYQAVLEAIAPDDIVTLVDCHI